MLDKDVTVGLKVVPHDKTVENFVGLDYSYNWNDAGGKDQGYLYVVEYESGSKCWALGVRPNSGGDYFNASDFEPLKKLYEDFHPMVTTDEFGHMIFG